ncbi:hypothetical protein AB9K41_08665, partial [Cribrihabitans sp. XS_ASV171]
ILPANFSETDSEAPIDGSLPEKTEVVTNIPLMNGTAPISGWPLDVVLAGDLSAAYVATYDGIAIVDMLSLRQFDPFPKLEGTNIIKIPGKQVQKLALSNDGNF